MKHLKRLVSLLLAACLLIGLPISVSAAGSTTPSDLRLIGAQPFIKGEVGVGNGIHNNSTWGDRGVILYFNQKLASFASAQRISLLVVDAENKVVTYGGKKLAWNLASHSEAPWVFRGYMVALFDRYGITYNNKTVVNWADIIDMLANAPELKGKGHRLQVRIYENKSTSDSLVDTCATASGVKLAATGNDTVDAAKYMSGDFAAMDLGTVAAGATTVTRTGVANLHSVKVINENDLQLSYSRPMTARTADVAAALEAVAANGTVLRTFAAGMVNASNVRLDEGWTAVQAVLDANAGSYARLKLTEKNPVAARDERYHNYVLDSIYATSGQMPLQGELTHVPVVTNSIAQTADYLYCPVTPPATDEALRLERAQVQTVEGKDYIVLTFSQPVSWNASSLGAWISLDIVGPTGGVVTINGSLCDRALSRDALAYYGASGRQVILPLVTSGTNFGGKTSVAEMRAWAGDLGNKQMIVRIIDQTGAANLGNGLVDCFWSTADPTNKLVCNRLEGTEEWGIVALEEAPAAAPQVKSVYVYKQNSLIVTFDRATVLTPNLYSAVRLVDENNTLYWRNADGSAFTAGRTNATTSPVQWMVSATTLSNGQEVSVYAPYGQSDRQVIGTLATDYSAMLEMVSAAERYFAAQGTPKDLSLKLVFEEKNADASLGKITSSNYVVDGIYADGVCLPASKGNANGHYAPLSEANAITLAAAYGVSDSAAELLFSAPVRTDIYSADKTVGVRLQMMKADGSAYTLNTGYAPVYDGVLTPVDGSGNAEDGYTRWELRDLYQSAYGGLSINILDILAALNTDEGQYAGCKLKLTLTESVDRGNVVGWIDNITSADGHDMLKANDGEAASVVLDATGEKAVTVERVEMISESKLRVVFSEEVKMTSTLTGLLRLSDEQGYVIGYENGAYTKKVADGRNWLQWTGSFAPASGTSGKEWVFTMTYASASAKTFTGTFALSRIYDAWESEWKDKGYILGFHLEDGALRANGLIDQIESVATGRKLIASNILGGTATAAGWNDFLRVDVCKGAAFASGTPQVLGVTQHSKNQLLVTFDQPMNFYNANVALPYVGLRLVGDTNLAVCYINAATNGISHSAYAAYEDGAPQYWNSVLGEATRDEICKDANGAVVLDKDGNPVKNSRRTNTVIQWSSIGRALSEDRCSMIVTFAEDVDVAALVNEDNLLPYMKDGYSVMFCIEETDTKDGSFTTDDKLIHNFVNDYGRQLRANKPSSGNNGTVVPVTLIDPDAPVTVTDVKITGEGEITFRFSEPIELGKNSTLLRYVDRTTGRLFKTEDGFIQWGGKLDYADQTKMVLVWTLDASNPANKNLRASGLAEIADLVSTKDDLRGLDGVFMLCMEETSNATKGFIDTFSALSGKAIESQPFIPGSYDGVYIPVDMTSAIRGELSVVSATAMADNKLVVTFSAPVAIEGVPWYCIRLFDKNNNMITKDGTAMQWGLTLREISKDGTQLTFTLQSAKSMPVRSLPDILSRDWSDFGEGAGVRFYIEEKDTQMVTYNGHVDNIVRADNGNIHLDATDFNERDGAGIAITMGYTPAILRPSVTVINESQLRVDFGRKVQIVGEIYTALCYVDEKNTLLNHLGTGRGNAQWGGNWAWADETHTAIIWTMNAGVYGCKTIADVANKVGYLKDIYADAKVAFRIEEKSTDKYTVVGWNDRIDNLHLPDGKSFLPATGNGTDRCFISLGDTSMLGGAEVTLMSAKAVSNTTVELTFSEPITIKTGELAPTLAIRYLTKSGDSEVGIDGRTSSFAGKWEYKDDSHTVVVWTLDTAKTAARGASSLDDIFNYQGQLQWNKGARIAFVILDKAENAFVGKAMRVSGITDESGYRNLVANHSGEVSQVQVDIELGYELPAIIQTVERTVYVTDYTVSIAIGASLLVVGLIAAVLLGRKKH